MLVTEVEFLLRTARAFSPAQPERAIEFLSQALILTADPHLRFLMMPALSALRRHDLAAARKWLDRACGHQEVRRAGAKDAN